jgi:hypothetical protein
MLANSSEFLTPTSLRPRLIAGQIGLSHGRLYHSDMMHNRYIEYLDIPSYLLILQGCLSYEERWLKRRLERSFIRREVKADMFIL